ncbi:MAG: Type 1 glutamine amidotransferase-like domain-containing protein [Candidatus Saccharimonadales bacterium]
MRLLLTSNGLSNDSIAHALEELTGKKPTDTKIAFIPTAANPDRENKDWLIEDLYNIHSRGYYVDIIDLPAITQTKLKQALDNVDVIFVGGGNTFYLSYWIQKSGLSGMLPELLKSKVYAGISAGSMVAGRSLKLSSQIDESPITFADNNYDLIGPTGESSAKTLNLTDIVFTPHLNSEYFKLVRKDILIEKAKGLKWPVYALDDNSALKIVDDKIEVISEGDWTFIKPK